MENQFFFSQLGVDDLRSIIKDTVDKSIEEFVKKLFDKFPQEELLTLDEVAEYMKRTTQGSRNAIIGYGIIPHTYDENSNPHYLKSEVVEKVKKGPPPKWYIRERNNFLKKMNFQSSDSEGNNK